MNTAEVQELIADMPLTDEAKNEIISLQEAGAPSEDILNLVAAKLDDVERELIEATPEGAAVYKEAIESLSNDIVTASNEFEETMAKIEKDANVFDQEINKELDAARMQELTEERNNIAS